MCGIAGMIDLSGQDRQVPDVLRAMADALYHRGPDDGGYLVKPGLGLVSRRLSIVGGADGRQPLANETRDVFVVLNGELFDYAEVRAQLEQNGHRLQTNCDTELLPHLWEERQEEMLGRLRGQFAFAVWDERQQRLTLARDRFGICPLYWTRQRAAGGDWLLFASEIKALLATGLVEAKPDLRGIDQVFTFLCAPGPLTCFEGVQALLPGHYLTVQRCGPGRPARFGEKTYWEMDYPDYGQEERGELGRLLDGFEERLLRAVKRRLRSDAPVTTYLSGGVDSSLVVAVANKAALRPLPTFTIQVRHPGLDEARLAQEFARRLGSESVCVSVGRQELLDCYPGLIEAAEAPVGDTACAALLLLARAVHDHGFKVALTGEGADEALAGYSWYKVHKLGRFLDAIPGLPLGEWGRRAFFRCVNRGPVPWGPVRRAAAVSGGYSAWQDFYNVLGLSKSRLYGPRFYQLPPDYLPHADLGIDVERVRRWHPLNQSLYLGMRVHLPGLLLGPGGDRVAMHSSVETRYPFLDEDVVTFLARLSPSWKLHGLRDKYLLRRLATRWLPAATAWRPKAPFQTPFDIFTSPGPAYVEQLLSPESLRRTDYFDVGQVSHWRRAVTTLPAWSLLRTSLAIGLASVVATQLWHHLFIEDALADLPSFRVRTLPADGREKALALSTR
jgi:asparagine synthase (glutamine-hydrolysing)